MTILDASSSQVPGFYGIARFEQSTGAP